MFQERGLVASCLQGTEKCMDEHYDFLISVYFYFTLTYSYKYNLSQ